MSRWRPGRPFVRGDVTDAGAYEHQRAVPVGKPPTTRVRRRISCSAARSCLFVQILLQCPSRTRPAGRSSSRQTLPQHEQFAATLSLTDSISVATCSALAGGFPGFHGEYGLGRRTPIRGVGGVFEHVAHEMHHAPLVSRLGQHPADRGDGPAHRSPTHRAHALQAAVRSWSGRAAPAVLSSFMPSAATRSPRSAPPR